MSGRQYRTGRRAHHDGAGCRPGKPRRRAVRNRFLRRGFFLFPHPECTTTYLRLHIS